MTERHELARLLEEVWSLELWKRRGYDSFRAYVEKEVGISYRRARRLMREVA